MWNELGEEVLGEDHVLVAWVGVMAMTKKKKCGEGFVPPPPRNPALIRRSRCGMRTCVSQFDVTCFCPINTLDFVFAAQQIVGTVVLSADR